MSYTYSNLVAQRNSAYVALDAYKGNSFGEFRRLETAYYQADAACQQAESSRTGVGEYGLLNAAAAAVAPLAPAMVNTLALNQFGQQMDAFTNSLYSPSPTYSASAMYPSSAYSAPFPSAPYVYSSQGGVASYAPPVLSYEPCGYNPPYVPQTPPPSSYNAPVTSNSRWEPNDVPPPRNTGTSNTTTTTCTASSAVKTDEDRRFEENLRDQLRQESEQSRKAAEWEARQAMVPLLQSQLAVMENLRSKIEEYAAAKSEPSKNVVKKSQPVPKATKSTEPPKGNDAPSTQTTESPKSKGKAKHWYDSTDIPMPVCKSYIQYN